MRNCYNIKCKHLKLTFNRIKRLQNKKKKIKIKAHIPWKTPKSANKVIFFFLRKKHMEKEHNIYGSMLKLMPNLH